MFAGAADQVQAASEALERVLLDQGMAQPDTALCAQDTFGTRIEHARSMTAHDLAAMMALQYENMGLDALWPVLETALLAPGREVVLDQPPEPLLRYDGNEATLAMFTPDAWRAHYGIEDGDGEQLRRRFQQFEMRQKQFAAVLGAHGIPVLFEHTGGSR